MSEPVRVVSHPGPDDRSAPHEHLWALVGGGGHHEGATAFYMGPDRDIEAADLLSGPIAEVVSKAKKDGLAVEYEDVERALADYRQARGTAS
jgi:hypothetical protein